MPATTSSRVSRLRGGIVLAMLAGLAACQGPELDEQERETADARAAAEQAAVADVQAGTEPPPVGNCDATQVQGLVGQAYTDETGEQARDDAAAQQLRVLKPGDMTTMEFVGERLNIELDEEGKISGVRCG